jgi:hypothetical protein
VKLIDRRLTGREVEELGFKAVVAEVVLPSAIPPVFTLPSSRSPTRRSRVRGELGERALTGELGTGKGTGRRARCRTGLGEEEAAGILPALQPGSAHPFSLAHVLLGSIQSGGRGMQSLSCYVRRI